MANFSSMNPKGESSILASNNDGTSKFNTVSLHWTNEEDALLQKGLVKYGSSESNKITRYAKIAALLNGSKTVREVALRCRWMSKIETSMRRKEGIDERRAKDRKN